MSYENFSLTTGGAGSTKLPDTSLSRMVMVAMVIEPNMAPCGFSGPNNTVKVSCHSTSELYRMSTGNSTSWIPEKNKDKFQMRIFKIKFLNLIFYHLDLYFGSQ